MVRGNDAWRATPDDFRRCAWDDAGWFHNATGS